MRPEERNFDSLRDMRQYAREILRFAEGKTRSDLGDIDTRAVLERYLEIVGEAARRITTEFRIAHPNIPWSQVVALRNILAHQYGSVDRDTLWDIATARIPELLVSLEELIPADAEGA